MTTVVLVAHAPLASAFQGTGGHCYAERAGEVLALDVQPSDSPESVAAQLEALLGPRRGNGPVLVLADTLGATPWGGAQAYALTHGATRVLPGLNLPMLWRTLCYLDKPFDELVTIAAEGGIEGIRRGLEP